MIKKSLLITSLVISSSFSLGLDDIVHSTFNESYDLQKLEKNIAIADQDVALAKTWSNPVLSIGANDVQFNDTFSRDKEPMQATYVAITQLIPVNGKLDYETQIASENKKIAQMDLENKKLKLASLIYQYGYESIITQKKLELLQRYEQNTQELETIALSLYENSKVKQVFPLQVQLLNSKLQLQKENLNFRLKSLALKLEQITYKKDLKLDETLSIDTPYEPIQNLSEHPVIKSIEYAKGKFDTLAKLENAKKYSDLKVSLGYFARDAKYTDYVNLSFSMPLPLYGRENINVAKAKYQSAMQEDELEKTKIEFENNFLILKQQMQKSYANYKNLSTSIIPQREYIQQNLESHNALGHANSAELLTNINEIISLEMLSLDELENYFSAYAKIKYFTGTVQ